MGAWTTWMVPSPIWRRTRPGTTTGAPPNTYSFQSSSANHRTPIRSTVSMMMPVSKVASVAGIQPEIWPPSLPRKDPCRGNSAVGEVPLPVTGRPVSSARRCRLTVPPQRNSINWPSWANSCESPSPRTEAESSETSIHCGPDGRKPVSWRPCQVPQPRMQARRLSWKRRQDVIGRAPYGPVPSTAAISSSSPDGTSLNSTLARSELTYAR